MADALTATGYKVGFQDEVDFDLGWKETEGWNARMVILVSSTRSFSQLAPVL